MGEKKKDEQLQRVPNRPPAVPEGLTDEDLRLGKVACRRVEVIKWIALALCIGIAIYTFMTVPWDTRMPYDGKYDRSGKGLPMQIAMLPAPAVLVGFLRSGRKPDAHQMGKGSRIATYILTPAIAVGCAWGQWIMAEGILIAGGALPG
jgi:hypothetical protein